MSPNLPGDLLIFFAFAFNLIVGVLFFLIARGKTSYESLAKRSYNVLAICITLAVAYLYYLFFTHNFMIRYVYDYSDRSLPFFYILSSFWGGQEGTYLLWLFFNVLLGYLLIYKSGQYRNYAMVVFSLVNLFFLLILMKLSPFALTKFQAADGAGLNPLLQDPWMVVHPPVIFIGYAMSAIPFSIAMSALIINDFSGWVKRIFPWVAVTAIMLGGGNILGGYWAYKTLGWGGYWAWDPVENSSFIPWFVSLALIHGLVIERRTGALRKSNVLMTAFVFVLIVYGTFLTRSGVLADFSVHSFVDLGINQYLIGFLVFFALMTLILFFPRIKAMGHVPMSYNIYNREFFLFGGMMLLFLFSVVVLFWTSLPLLTKLVGADPRAADVSTYNDFAVPFAILYALFLAASPSTNFTNYKPAGWMGKLAVAAVVGLLLGFGLFHFMLGATMVFAVVFTIVVCGLFMFLLKSDLRKSLLLPLVGLIAAIAISLLVGVHDYMFLLFFGVVSMALVANTQSVVDFLPGRWNLMGGQLAHAGFGFMLIGILASSAFTTSDKLVLPRGQGGEAMGLSVVYNGMENDIDFPKNRLLLSYTEGGQTSDARPELFYSERLNGIMRRPFIEKHLLYDFYFSPEQIQDLPSGNDLTLIKNQPKTVAGYQFTFTGFNMGSHENADSGMTVVVNIDVAEAGDVMHLAPAVKVVPSPNGNRTIDLPAKFGPNDEYTISVAQILADQGGVMLHIPGLIASGPPDRLILDISKKPIINLVWLGTTLVLLGSILVYLRRRSELSSAA